MSNLILEVKLNKLRGFTIFPQSLKIFEDMVVFRKRRWFNVDEMTVTYNHIAQANLTAGILFSTIQIITSGGAQTPFINHVWKKSAAKAHEVIEQKIYRSHSTHVDKREFQAEKDTEILGVERSLNRLRELRRKGKITDKEFQEKRKKLLKRIG